jgi:hypothetical protein
MATRVLRRDILGAVVMLAGASPLISAQSVGDLVTHNGFETCWSAALTKPQFLDLLRSGVDGQTGCVPPSGGTVTLPGFGSVAYTACTTPACPGAVPGCPVTTHAGTFSGDFATGIFSGAGSADTVQVPVSSAAFGTCTLVLSNITFAFAPAYVLDPDGNSGVHASALVQAGVTSSYALSASGGALCSLLPGLVEPQLHPQLDATASAAYAEQLTATTVGQSVCPLVP